MFVFSNFSKLCLLKISLFKHISMTSGYIMGFIRVIMHFSKARTQR